ncbi:hypothetical protein Dda_2566 [Drechslerella dactyloides]|uniref:Nudix hydrolase domain-containing protein n=1 Tax=Drechslerella dactyloides TaxID=74499 RepID=A0AAD6J0N8_DREDA|nr:hypothetical protein Dda_2566 [Drechslerella dactyloides]
MDRAQLQVVPWPAASGVVARLGAPTNLASNLCRGAGCNPLHSTVDSDFSGASAALLSRSLSTYNGAVVGTGAASLLRRRSTFGFDVHARSRYTGRIGIPMAAKKEAVNPHSYTTLQPGPIAVPRPSASLVLLDAQNRILLTHRTSSVGSFANAHVFPGGNQDADDPSPEFCAIRETFEETGMLLTTPPAAAALTATFTEARRQIHARKVTFGEWLARNDLAADTGGLLPFTTWVTPPTMKKRYETRMFLGFLPASDSDGNSATATETSAHLPTADGGVETVSATFMTATEILAAMKAKTIILFPPQLYLVMKLARFTSDGRLTVMQQREAIRDWLKAEGMGAWVFAPRQEGMTKDGKRLILGYGPRGDHGSKSVLRFGPTGMPEDLEIVPADIASRL